MHCIMASSTSCAVRGWVGEEGGKEEGGRGKRARGPWDKGRWVSSRMLLGRPSILEDVRDAVERRMGSN